MNPATASLSLSIVNTPTIEPQGRFLYFGVTGLASMRINVDGTLGSFVADAVPGPEQLRSPMFDPSGQFAWSNTLGGESRRYRVNADGTLTDIGPVTFGANRPGQITFLFRP
jgi:hypothetical protein